jgi:hypothetical protein
MTARQDNGDLLSSWKEIADYLGCKERTCQRWELNLGMPVHRMEGAAKSRVFAYKVELDAWRKEKLNGSVGANCELRFEEEPAAGSSTQGAGQNGGPRRESGPGARFGADAARRQFKLNHIGRKLLWLIPVTAGVLAAALFFIRSSPGEPADFRIDGSKLIIRDKKGKELWDFDTGLENLISEKAYRTRFQIRSEAANSGTLLPLIIMKDINRDKKVETLFCAKTRDEYDESGLFCFDDRGRQLWAYKPGREINFGGRIFSADFRIFGIETCDINHDADLETFMISSHMPHSPSELAALDCHGKVLGEFINWGQFHDLIFADFEGNGKAEVAVAGQNDEYEKACLAVFDPSRISGASPQSERFRCRNCAEGSEKFYIIMPRTDVDLSGNREKESIVSMHLLQNFRFDMMTGNSRIYFEFDYRMNARDVKGSDGFRAMHRELVEAGKLKSELDNAYYEALREGVLYWNGKEWTSTPSMNVSASPGKGPGS